MSDKTSLQKTEVAHSPAKKYPRITVVLQCFNRANYIGETIESIVNQNYPNTECIVIDDNSSDNSWEVIQRYKDKIAYAERLPGHRTTPVPALNYGLSKSTGDYMTTLNDKNLLMPKSLFTIAEVVTKYPEIDWVTGIGLIADREGRITNVTPIRKDFYDHLLPVRWNIQHESTFWSRRLWEKVGAHFNESSWAFDADIWSRFFASGAKLFHLNTIVGAYRKIPSSHGNTKSQEYYHYHTQARHELRAKVAKKELVLAEIYRVLYKMKPILRNIPDRVYARIPFLNHFCHEAIRFENVNAPAGAELVRYKRNPFRTIFPW